MGFLRESRQGTGHSSARSSTSRGWYRYSNNSTTIWTAPSLPPTAGATSPWERRAPARPLLTKPSSNASSRSTPNARTKKPRAKSAGSAPTSRTRPPPKPPSPSATRPQTADYRPVYSLRSADCSLLPSPGRPPSLIKSACCGKCSPPKSVPPPPKPSPASSSAPARTASRNSSKPWSP